MDREAGGSKGGKGKANESTTFVYRFYLGTLSLFKGDELFCFSFLSQYWLDKGPREI